MKLYCKIKVDGVWQWYVGDQPWKVATARALCECRVCRPGKPETISQEKRDVCLMCKLYKGECTRCGVETTSSEEE